MSRSTESDLNPDELRHYSRQIAMPQFGEEGQKKLKHAKIAVIGAGGLGAPVLQYLAAAGVGTIGIFDFDVVEESNLHRQVLFNRGDIGKPKAKVAADRLKKLNPHINIIAHQALITPENVIKQLEPYGLAVDGSDNFLTRYIINDACLILDIPLVYGSIYRFEGQCTVFNYVGNNGMRGPNLYGLYPEMPEEGFIPDCNTAGVLGVLPGVIGSIQATEAIKIATGIGEVLSGNLLLMSLLNNDTKIIRFSPSGKNKDIDRQAVLNRLKRYRENHGPVAQISAGELSGLKENSGKITLVDVRSKEEHEWFNIGGLLIPLEQLEEKSSLLPKDKKIVMYCETGRRSTLAIRKLNKLYNDLDLYNLTGGLASWAGEKSL